MPCTSSGPVQQKQCSNTHRQTAISLSSANKRLLLLHGFILSRLIIIFGAVSSGIGSFSQHPSIFDFRALADILRQQGPVPVSQYEHDNMDTMMDGSPKDETPVRTAKNNYTPVHAKSSNHGNDTACLLVCLSMLVD